MKTITYLQALELIDLAVKEDRLYHYNGGQAYIRVSMELDALMIIDNTTRYNVNIQLMDGTDYFKTCAGYNYTCSKNMRENHKGLVEWYKHNTQLVELDLV